MAAKVALAEALPEDRGELREHPVPEGQEDVLGVIDLLAEPSRGEPLRWPSRNWSTPNTLRSRLLIRRVRAVPARWAVRTAERIGPFREIEQCAVPG